MAEGEILETHDYRSSGHIARRAADGVVSITEVDVAAIMTVRSTRERHMKRRSAVTLDTP